MNKLRRQLTRQVAIKIHQSSIGQLAIDNIGRWLRLDPTAESRVNCISIAC